MAKTITGVGILKTLKEKFSKKGVWIQGSYAADKKGEAVDRHSPEAVKFCLRGGIQNIAGPKGNYVAKNRAESLIKQTPTFKKVCEEDLWVDGVIGFNDSGLTTKAKVLKALDEAIKLARSAASKKGAQTKAAAKKAATKK